MLTCNITTRGSLFDIFGFGDLMLVGSFQYDYICLNDNVIAQIDVKCKCML